MEVGQVSFHQDKEVVLVKNVAKNSDIVKRLTKTKTENMKLDFKTLREERDAKERAEQKERERKQREQDKELAKKRAQDAELRQVLITGCNVLVIKIGCRVNFWLFFVLTEVTHR